MPQATLGVLVPWLGARPAPPEDRPLGRAALRLARDGIDVVFGDRADDGVLIGWRAIPGDWEPAAARIVAAYDRFPSQGRPGDHRALLAALPNVRIANDPGTVALCRDKLATQLRLDGAVPMPEVEADPAAFSAALDAWGAGYVKPRHGSFGRGVRRVVAGEAVPAQIDGDPTVLQRAVPPPAGWAGVCARVLVQRDRDGSWVCVRPVLRRSRTDPVVNAARGAEVALLEVAAPGAVDRVLALGRAVAAVLGASPWCVELGVDVVLDGDGAPWVVEVNGTPRGRLEVLAAVDPAWTDAHVEACARPLRYLAALRA